MLFWLPAVVEAILIGCISSSYPEKAFQICFNSTGEYIAISIYDIGFQYLYHYYSEELISKLLASCG